MPSTGWLLAHSPIWLAVVVGLLVLRRYHHRSRRVAALGALALCGYGVWPLLDILAGRF